MRFIWFRINNFRGIQEAKVDLTPSGAGIFSLIGLNESGKTTVLEAISTFQVRGGDEKSLYQANPAAIDSSSFVPKHQKANFTGDITVEALVEFEGDDKGRCIRYAEEQSGSKIDPASAPDTVVITRGYRFKNGDQVERLNNWSIRLSTRDKGSRKFKPAADDHKAWKSFIGMASVLMPEIVYFPTFLFQVPEKVVLNPAETEVAADRLYREIIENVGQSLSSPIDVETSLVERITKPETDGEPFLGFFMLSNNRQQQIEAVINQLSHRLSTTVLDSWSRIFGGHPGDREIRLKLGVDKHASGEPRVYVQFTVRDGTQTYDIEERSTGFRWFFSFLLFTLYRARSSSNQCTLFLLDEPASNLHAGAQSQLLDSLPRIASRGNQIMYSTHSHYLINPSWLDQAFIISNAAMAYNDVTDRPPAGSRHTMITVERYRSFVGNNPDKTTYFQPVLDRLQVVPSRLDALQPSVLVEGKGDYLILTHGLNLLERQGLYAVIPTRGTGGFDELVGMLLGWGVNFALCCDDDAAGRKAVAEYIEHWGLPASKIFTLASASVGLKGCKIEGVLEPADRALIAEHFGLAGEPDKGQIQLFFSEKLAIQESVAISETFRERVAALDDKIRAALGLDVHTKPLRRKGSSRVRQGRE